MSSSEPIFSVPASPSTTIAMDYGSPHADFGFFREAMADTCDVALQDASEPFHAAIRVLNAGPAVLTEVQTCSLSYQRSARHIARSSYDHYQIQLNLAGHSYVRSGRQSTVFRRGDIGIVDTVRTSDTVVPAADGQPAHCISVFVPRAVLGPLFASPDSEHCTVLHADTRIGLMLREHLICIMQNGATMTAPEVDTSMQVLLGLVASGFGPAAAAELPVRRAIRHAALTSAKRYIERRLESPELSTALICRRFGWSRATVYRLFEPDGGLLNYIQGRRLQHAFSALMSPGVPDRRILEIALDCQFASDATFNRAFRRAFGIPPGELRALAKHAHADERRGAQVQPDRDEVLAVRWIKQLSAGRR